MSIETATIEIIAKTFVGDEGDCFPRLTGPQIFGFFNDHFGYRDEYVFGGNMPTRWRHAAARIAELMGDGKANRFFSAALSRAHMMAFGSYSEAEARQMVAKGRLEIDRLLAADGYKLAGAEGDFRLTEIDEDLVPLGRGGFADAYLRKSDGLVVKKLNDSSILDQRARHRFKREFEIMKKLSGTRGVLEVYAFDASSLSYTMERGECTLREFLEQPLSEESKYAILEQILSTMAEVHDGNVIHRDLSPNNVFVMGGELKVADFGLGKSLDDIGSYQTADTANYGTLAYCAPEQLQKLKDGDKRSDVFSLGRIVNFVMTGDPHQCAHPLRAVAEKATSASPDNRYQDARSMLRGMRQRMEINSDEARREAIRAKARQGVLDEEVRIWLLCMEPIALCKAVLNVGGRFADCITEFACSGDREAEFVIDSFGAAMAEACGRSFAANDPFAFISAEVARSKVAFDIRERACRIIAYVARYVNRWHIQDLVERMKSEGIDPMLEEVLDEHPSSPNVPG